MYYFDWPCCDKVFSVFEAVDAAQATIVLSTCVPPAALLVDAGIKSVIEARADTKGCMQKDMVKLQQMLMVTAASSRQQTAGSSRRLLAAHRNARCRL
jgi:hypothetical protein